MKNKYIWIAVATFVILALVFEIFIVIPGQKLAFEKEKEMSLKIQRIIAEGDYADCKQSAFSDYDFSWKSACKSRKLGEDCMLPTNQAQVLDKTLAEAKSDCLEVYKLNSK